MNIGSSILLLPAEMIRTTIIAVVPALAWAVSEQTQIQDPGAIASMSALVWSAILFFSLVGWAVNDLDKVAELWKVGGTVYEQWKARLMLLKGIVASLAAGIFTYFIGKSAPGPILAAFGLKGTDGSLPVIPEMILFILVAGGAYMGTRWFAALERKVTGKAKDEGAVP